MKIGITGYPNSGKKTLFNLLTGSDAALINRERQKPVPGMASIADNNFKYLVDLYEPAKEVPARIAIELVPDLSRSVIQEGAVFRDISNLDALCHVVRVFEDDSVYHAEGSVNPERDIENINNEFILHDLLFVEKRLERIEQGKKKKNDDSHKKEEELMHRFRDHLDKNEPLRTFDISPEDRMIIASYPLITLKELIIVLNVNDERISDFLLDKGLAERLKLEKTEIMNVSAKVEAEIAALESDEERAEFMSAMNISEPVINMLFKKCMKALGLISFYTVGKDEVRQWLVRKGATAPEAARAIHSDIERGFIRAEVMSYNDLVELGSEENIKKAGKYGIMGKDYLVRDSDIISFRFNV